MKSGVNNGCAGGQGEEEGEGEGGDVKEAI